MKKQNKSICDILSDTNDIQLLGKDVSLEPLEDILPHIEPELLTVFAYILMTSIRPILREYETYVGSVLCISGDHGWGEDEFAAWAGGIYTQDKKLLGIAPKGSTYKDIDKKLRSLKNQPLVVDDRHLKGNKYKRQKVTWDLFNEGIDPSCEAGLILLMSAPMIK